MSRAARLMRLITDTFRLDIFFKLSLVTAFALVLAYVLPLTDPQTFNSFVESYLDIGLNALMVLGALIARGQASTPEGRRFFLTAALAYGLWWFLRVMMVLPGETARFFQQFGAEYIYLSFYLLFFVALQTAPDIPRGDAHIRGFRWIQNALPILFLAALFTYAAVLPALNDYETYLEEQPSFLYYIILDLFLGIQFLVVSGRARSRSWRLIHGFVGVHMLGWAMIDVATMNQEQYAQGMLYGGIFWYLPNIFFALACLVHIKPIAVEETPTWIRQMERYDTGPLVIIYGLSLPLLHMLGSVTGLLDETLETQRDLLVLVWLLLVSILIVVQHRLLNQRTRLLEIIRGRNLQLLKGIGQAQSGFIADAPRDQLFRDMLLEAVRLSESRAGFIRGYLGDEHQPDAFELLAALDMPELPERLEAAELPKGLYAGLRAFKPRLEPFDPEGPDHPDNSALWLPLKHGDHLVGLMVLAQRKGGYDRELLVYLETYLRTCAGIVSAFQMERERRRISEHMHSINQILDQAQEEIYLFDAATLALLQCNRGVRENVGLDWDALKDKTFLDLVPESEHAVYRAQFERLRSGAVNRVVFSGRHQRAGGDSYPVDCFIHRTHFEGRTVFVAFAADVSERRAMEEEKASLTAQIIQSQKMETVGTLAGGIAHDFNNVLTPIIWSSEMMLKDMPPPDEAREHLEHMLLAARRAREIIQQLLTFSRRSMRRMEPVNLGDLITETLALLKSSRPHNVTMKVRAGTPAWVTGDASQLQQVLMNLCTNAFHALGADGGELAIELAVIDVGPEYVRTHPFLQEGRFVRLLVRDNGPGMDEETRKRIFEPFFTTKPVGEGTGLGLAVLHGIVHGHGGVVTVDSELEQGTCFTIYLPPGKVGDREPVTPVSRAFAQNSARILLLDDDPRILEMARALLEDAGYQVTTAQDGQQGLDLFRSAPDHVDLVITDSAMPKLSGLQLAAAMLKQRADLPIVLMTGAEVDVEDGQGFARVLRKPMSAEELLSVVGEVLAGRRDQATGRVRG